MVRVRWVAEEEEGLNKIKEEVCERCQHEIIENENWKKMADKLRQIKDDMMLEMKNELDIKVKMEESEIKFKNDLQKAEIKYIEIRKEINESRKRNKEIMRKYEIIQKEINKLMVVKGNIECKEDEQISMTIEKVIDTDNDYFEDSMSSYSGLGRVVEEALEVRWEEQKQRNQRKCNLVIFNLKESDYLDVDQRIEYDKVEVRKLIEKGLGIENFCLERVTRLGRIEKDRNRPLLVKLGNENEKWSILSKNKELKKTEEYRKIYINRDLTKNEREKDKDLRNELTNRRMEDSEYKWKISKGKVERGDKKIRDRKLGHFIAEDFMEKLDLILRSGREIKE